MQFTQVTVSIIVLINYYFKKLNSYLYFDKLFIYDNMY